MTFQPVAYGVLVCTECTEIHVGWLAVSIQTGGHDVIQLARRTVLYPCDLHELLYGRALVGYFLIEGVPVGDILAVGHAHHQDGQAGLAEEHLFEVFFVRLDVSLVGHGAVAFPEGVPVDEKVLVLGLLTVFEQILELRAEHRGMV